MNHLSKLLEPIGKVSKRANFGCRTRDLSLSWEGYCSLSCWTRPWKKGKVISVNEGRINFVKGLILKNVIYVPNLLINCVWYKIVFSDSGMGENWL